MPQGQFLCGIKLVFFLLVWLPKGKEFGLPCYLPTIVERTDGFISFLRALARNEMQSALSRV